MFAETYNKLESLKTQIWRDKDALQSEFEDEINKLYVSIFPRKNKKPKTHREKFEKLGEQGQKIFDLFSPRAKELQSNYEAQKTKLENELFELAAIEPLIFTDNIFTLIEIVYDDTYRSTCHGSKYAKVACVSIELDFKALGFQTILNRKPGELIDTPYGQSSVGSGWRVWANTTEIGKELAMRKPLPKDTPSLKDICKTHVVCYQVFNPFYNSI